ncbi:MAG: ABC transporter ATP-binding protein [Candidatus Uhrbacteria bacterium]|nr:ABC transporter ATP-binding protein [Candidatus Uhrbacteria bacterium]
MFEVIAFVYRNLDHFRRGLVAQFFISIVDSVFLFLVPLLLSEFTKKDFSPDKFWGVFLLVVFCYTMTLPLQLITRGYGEKLAMQFANYLRIKLYKRAEGLPLQKMHEYHSGYLLSLINRISDEMPGFISQDMVWGLSRTTVNVGLLFAVTARESLGLAFLNIFFLAMFLYLSSALGKRMVGLAHTMNTQRAAMLQGFSDFMANIMTVKRLGISSFARARLMQAAQATDISIGKIQRFHAVRWFVLHTIYGIMLLGTVGFFLNLVARGVVSPALLIVFVSVFVMIRNNIGFLGEAVKKMFELKAYIKNLEDILALAQSEEKATMLVPKTWHAINLSDIEMSYTGTHKVISIPRFTLTRGEKICISGLSGQGKSTFLNLLAKFYDPQGGAREIDGIMYEKISRTFFADHFAMISQEIELFSLSIRDNIALGSSVSDEEILSALQAVGLMEWLTTLQDGLDTLVGEKGIKLSAGQKQRVNLIRGLLLDRDIYLLDEPTSHLDDETESMVVAYLAEKLKNKTAVIVSHRPASRRLCTPLGVFCTAV